MGASVKPSHRIAELLAEAAEQGSLMGLSREGFVAMAGAAWAAEGIDGRPSFGFCEETEASVGCTKPFGHSGPHSAHLQWPVKASKL